MPWLVLMLIGALSRFIPYMVAKLLVSFGVGLVSYAIIQTLFETASGRLNTFLGGLPSDILALITMSGIAWGVAFFLGACTSCIALRAATVGFKKL